MKNSIVILLIAFFFVGCEKENPYNLSGTYQLTQDVALTLSKDKLPVTLVATNINDSRCPANVQCVWEGLATADVTFKGSEEEKAIKTCTGGCKVMNITESEIVILNGVSYEVKLKDVTNSENKIVAFVTLEKK